MKFSIAAISLALATVAVAVPNDYSAPKKPKMDIEQVQNTCGQAQVSCCNKQIKSVNGGDKNSGLLSGVLGTVLGGGSNVGIFDQCSKLNVAALIGVTDILNGGTCGQTVACCQGNEQKTEGLVAVGLPCIPIAL
ncbi:hypothetical protein FQN55_006513 [Onygenales sp. PD_40]|nr:hypothetical protein FQN55_006513 [Onygenales sp. PD_40]KAK2779097.1 hypothetical protein FQN53_001533 [Emmonsiellopsis sp. PD_33]KAK2788555.1 hypothetical protein FQN52_006668 [Onygenales sp. PD_12]KAK2807069.1 hypothetical protein FQN51_004683 [Onygenales sp. PD_10]